MTPTELLERSTGVLTPIEDATRREFITGLGAAALAAAFLAACGDDAEGDADASPGGAGYPVTIRHAYGDTTIATEPKRVVTVGFTDQRRAARAGRRSGRAA